MEQLGTYWTNFLEVLGVLLKSVQKIHVLVKFEQKSQEFSSFYGMKGNKKCFMCVCGSLVKNQIDYSRRGGLVKGHFDLSLAQ